MRHPFETETGDWLQPGDWIEMTLTDGRRAIGRFSGIWVNPHFGLVAQTVYTRMPDHPTEPVDTFFFVIRKKDDPQGENGDTPSYQVLRKARVVPKPGAKPKKAAPVTAAHFGRDTVLEAMQDLLAAIGEVDAGNDESVASILARAPADSTIHRVMSRMWRCEGCGGTGTFRDLNILLGAFAGDECPHCKAIDAIVMLEGAEAIGRA